jgi:putative tryptophan/tyrosine transport system substrate-binding protein
MNRLVGMVAIAHLLVAASSAHAQPAGGTARMCFLTFDPGSTMKSNRYGDFFGALRNLGYQDGKTLRVEYLSAEGKSERFPALAAECVKRRVDVIVASSTPAALAAKKATSTIPIVITPLGDPVGSGLVSSLSRPGGNLTGTTLLAPAIAAKRMELLKEAVPRVSRVLVLSYLIDPIAPPQVEQIKAVAEKLGVKVVIREIRTAEDLPAAFEAGARENVDAVMPTNESIFVANRQRVIELASKHRLPGIYFHRAFAQDGGLLVYAPNLPLLQARSAAYVDQVLKGAKPADLPIEQPSKFELIVNLKAANALGISMPQLLLLRADELIQ